ncbi:hypothetical protein HYT33_00700 [Candidatus Roizmanbacteria bacterium]|nr:hypothetical protein [Candidatus Roizmanbacteria bacterium]
MAPPVETLRQKPQKGSFSTVQRIDERGFSHEIPEFATHIERLTPEGHEILPGVHAYEAFYRVSGLFLHLVRRVSSQKAPLVYEQNWQELIIRAPILPDYEDDDGRRYYLGTSYVHRDDIDPDKLLESYGLYVGRPLTKKLRKYLRGQLPLSLNFFSDPGFLIEKASRTPPPAVYCELQLRGFTVRDQIDGKGFDVCRKRETKNLKLAKGKKEETADGIVSFEKRKELNALLATINPQKDRITI